MTRNYTPHPDFIQRAWVERQPNGSRILYSITISPVSSDFVVMRTVIDQHGTVSTTMKTYMHV